MEQMRDFDFVQGFRDVMYAVGGLAADITSGLPATVVGGLVATQTSPATLNINIASGRIYQFASADSTASGSIAQDLTSIVQQGYVAAQSITLVAPSAGQSQWNLIQAQFSQSDAVRAGDPNGGFVPFYNASNPTQPTITSINTVRRGLCLLQVITGAAATTGSEAPPNPTSGWVPLYMIDLAGGQTQITSGQILVCGPSVGTGVSSGYPAAPFLGGLLASHHSGTSGQAPKIKLASEVQGILPYANMSAVRTLLNSGLILYVNATTGADTNNGLSAAAPFKTIQAAVDSAYHGYDFNGNNLQINVANGTYNVSQSANQSAVAFVGMPLGCRQMALTGNPASPGSVALNATLGIAISALWCNLTIQGMTIACSGVNNGINSYSGYGLNVSSGAYVTIANMTFGSCGVVQAQSVSGATLIASGPLTFTGTTQFSVYAQSAGQWYNLGNPATLSSLTTTAFACAAILGILDWINVTFTGSQTGQRYTSTLNSIVNTNNAGANYFPGTLAGTTASGGLYV